MSSAPAPVPASASASARVAELFDRHGRMAYGICRAMLRDAHEAEDATQQAFLSAHRALLGGARVRDTGAWVATIARNECRARIAAGMRRPLPVADADLDGIPSRVDDVEQRLRAGELRDALAELPERQREAVVLRYVYGLRYGEVAKALALSRPATEALLFRARRALRIRLRHAASGALVVPLTVREELALALPGFEQEAGSGVAAVGVAGGLLAKLASAPAAAKLATATVAVSTVGVVGAAAPDRPASPLSGEAGAAEVLALGLAAGPVRLESGSSEEQSRASDDERSVQGDDSGPGSGSDEADDDRTRDDDEDARRDEDDAPASTDLDESGPGSVDDDQASPSGHGGEPRSSSSGPGDAETEHEEVARGTSSSSGTSGSGTSGSSSGPDEPEEDERSGEGSDSSGSSGSSGSEDDGSSGESGSDDEHDEGS